MRPAAFFDVDVARSSGDQQYLEKQSEQTPDLSVPALARARSTTAHARHAGQSGSVDAPASAGRPCVAITNVSSIIACTTAGAYVVCAVVVFVIAGSPEGAAPFAM